MCLTQCLQWTVLTRTRSQLRQLDLVKQHQSHVAAFNSVEALKARSRIWISRHVIPGPVDAGAAPLFFSERAMEKLKNRKTKPGSYCFDLNLYGDYWGALAGPMQLTCMRTDPPGHKFQNLLRIIATVGGAGNTESDVYCAVAGWYGKRYYHSTAMTSTW